MLLDSKFTLLPRIRKLTAKCQKDLNIMRLLWGTYFGSGRNSLLLLYKSIIRPKIGYGVIVYACASPTAIKMLDNFQRKALIIALRTLSLPPSVYLELEAGGVVLIVLHSSPYWSSNHCLLDSRPDRLENILSANDQCHLNGSEVTFVWCPVHVGFMGNELADGAAKRAPLGPTGDKIPLATTEVCSIL